MEGSEAYIGIVSWMRAIQAHAGKECWARRMTGGRWGDPGVRMSGPIPVDMGSVGNANHDTGRYTGLAALFGCCAHSDFLAFGVLVLQKSFVSKTHMHPVVTEI